MVKYILISMIRNVPVSPSTKTVVSEPPIYSKFNKSPSHQAAATNKSSAVVELNAKPIEELSSDALTPLKHPESDLEVSLQNLACSNWDSQYQAITTIRRLVRHHTQTIIPNLYVK